MLKFLALITIAASLCFGIARAEPSRAAQPVRPYLLHLPGIGGIMAIDRHFAAGLKDAAFDVDLEMYDWTCHDPGIDALVARERNQNEARKIAEKIVERFRRNPNRRIILTSHSGGTGLAVWALEKLPDDVTIDSLLLMAPALSPKYDLSNALRHVRGNAYVYSSPGDALVLGAGTKLFGTIDGIKSESAGLNGFIQPDDADAHQYEKLIPLPYNHQWMRYGNIGDHIGSMSRAFAREITVPLLRDGTLPQLEPTTRPIPAPAEQ